MGRKVESTIDRAGYKTCLDGDFIIATLFTNTSLFIPIGNIELKKIDLGSHGAINSMESLRSSFQRGKYFRQKAPDHYREHLRKLDKFHPEEYFKMSDFEKLK